MSANQDLTDKIDSLESKLSNFEHKYDTLNEKIFEQDDVYKALENRVKKKKSIELIIIIYSKKLKILRKKLYYESHIVKN